MKGIYLKPGIVLLVLLAFWPSLVWYVKRLGDGSDEPWGLLALLAGGGLLYIKRSAISFSDRGIIAAIVALLIYSLTFAVLPPLGRAALGLLSLALLTRTLWTIPGVWAVMFLSLPIMASLQFYIGYPMRIVAAIAAEAVLNFFNFEVVRRGTDLWRDGNVVGVDPPCSGIEMLWVGLVLVACYAAWMNWRFIGDDLSTMPRHGLDSDWEFGSGDVALL